MLIDKNLGKVKIFDVNYTHLIRDGDLYITDNGMKFIDHILPANWNDKKYYEKLICLFIKIPPMKSLQEYLKVKNSHLRPRIIDKSILKT